MMKCFIHHITKLEFLPAFKAAFFQALSQDNIQAGFRGAGLVPFNPEEVLSRLDIQLRSTPPPIETTIWQSKTPSNAAEFDLQSKLIRDRIQRHQNSSPTSIIESLDRLAKGAQSVANLAILVQAQVADLEIANQALAARKKRSKKRIQKQGVLTQAEGINLIYQNQVNNQIEHEMRQVRSRRDGSAVRQYTCNGYGERGHRINQCSLR
jgi:hypothetical protein